MLNFETRRPSTTNLKIATLTHKATQQSIGNKTLNSIDWSLPVSLPKWLSEEQYVRMISNLIYGENATVRACKMLQIKIDSGDYHTFLSTQISDEESHAGIYKRYLGLLGQKEMPSEDWCAIIENCLETHTSPIELVVAFHILLEGEAVFLQKLISDYMPCPLFTDINKKIRLDEARHVAFGKIILPQLIDALPQNRKKEILIWAKSLWFSSAKILVTEYLNPSMVKSFVISQLLETRWKKQKKILKGLNTK